MFRDGKSIFAGARGMGSRFLSRTPAPPYDGSRRGMGQAGKLVVKRGRTKWVRRLGREVAREEGEG
jgi:hypothetical protein